MLKQPSSTIVMILRISVVNKDHNYDKFSKTIKIEKHSRPLHLKGKESRQKTKKLVTSAKKEGRGLARNII